jgi:hypothetical protein
VKILVGRRAASRERCADGVSGSRPEVQRWLNHAGGETKGWERPIGCGALAALRGQHVMCRWEGPRARGRLDCVKCAVVRTSSASD